MSFITNSKKFLGLAFPMVISNVFVPVAGLVDTAIVGHLPGAHYLAGVALASVVLTQIIWICGFLRMSTTGLSARGKGTGDSKMLAETLRNASIMALVIGFALILLNKPLFELALLLSDSREDVAVVASDYFQIRIYFIIVPLFNLVLSGWMLGQQWHRRVMFIQIMASVINVFLSYLFAITFELGVTGVALATVASELLVMTMNLIFILRDCPQVRKKLLNLEQYSGVRTLLSLNTDMFIRNMVLQLCLAAITFMGLRLGDLTAATNAVLMQFFVLIALGLDGIAYSVEALVGESQGKQDTMLRRWVNTSLIWSNVFAVAYAVLFLAGFSFITSMMTNMTELQNNMYNFRWYIVLLPLVAHWCFTFDGIYIGLMRADIMRNTMLLSAAIALTPILLFTKTMTNHVIWSCFLAFLLLRGVTLLAHFAYYVKKQHATDAKL